MKRSIFCGTRIALATAYVGLQSRLPFLLLTLSSAELTACTLVGMCLGALRRPRVMEVPLCNSEGVSQLGPVTVEQ